MCSVACNRLIRKSITVIVSYSILYSVICIALYSFFLLLLLTRLIGKQNVTNYFKKTRVIFTQRVSSLFLNFETPPAGTVFCLYVCSVYSTRATQSVPMIFIILHNPSSYLTVQYEFLLPALLPYQEILLLMIITIVAFCIESHLPLLHLHLSLPN